MSKVKIYQAGQKVTQEPVTVNLQKYKFVLDGKEYEFTDDELDKAWSDDALKSILREGGIREDDLNDRYVQLKDQALSGKYSFDTTPSLTISGSYEGGSAQLGTDKRIHAVDKIFGVHNKGKQMNTVNYYLPIALKKIVTEREKLNLLLQSEKEKLDKEKNQKEIEKLYLSVAKGYGFGHLAYGEEYDNSLADPTKMKTLLTPYWSMTELERRNILTQSGSGLKTLYDLTPEQLVLIEEKNPGFTQNREKIIKWYDAKNNMFNFSSLPTMNDLWNKYSNDLESMLLDLYLFDQSKLLTPTTTTGDIKPEPSLIDTDPDYTEDQQLPPSAPKISFYEQVANAATRIEIPESRYLENSILKRIFPNYKPNLGYWLAWHTKGKVKDIFFAPLTDANGVIRKNAEGKQLIRVFTYDKPTNQITASLVYDPDYFEKVFAGKMIANGPQEDVVEYLERLDATNRPKTPLQSNWDNLRKSFNETFSFVSKGQKGMIIKLRSDKMDEDRMNYIQLLLDKYQIPPLEALQKYQEWVNNGLIIEKTLNRIQKPLPDTKTDYSKIIPGANKSAATTWHSQTFGNIADKGVDGLSRVDWEDLITLGLDLTSLVPGPTGAIAGVLGGISGMVADIERDGLDVSDVGYGLLNTGIGALSFIPGVGLLKSARIAKNVMRLKKLVPVLHTLFTGIGLYAAADIIKKGAEDGFENLSLEDMRMLGSAIVGLRNAKNILKKVLPYEKVSTGQSKVLPVEFRMKNGKIVRHQVMFDENELLYVRSGQEGKTQEQLTKELILKKIPKDSDLSSRVGNEITEADIKIPMTSAPRTGIKKLKVWGNTLDQVDFGSSAIQIKAPTDMSGSKWQLFKNKFYTGNQNELIFQQRSNPDRFQNVIPNKNVTAERLTEKDGELISELGNTEINATSLRELDFEKAENKQTINKLKELNKTKDSKKILEEDMLELNRKREKNVFINKADTERSKDAINELTKIGKKLKNIEGKYLDPEMKNLVGNAKKNLVDVIKAHKDKLIQIRNQAEANNKLTMSERRSNLLKKLNTVTESDSRFLMGDGRPLKEKSKKINKEQVASKEDIILAIKKLDEIKKKFKRGFKTKLDLSPLGLKQGGIIKLQSGLTLFNAALKGFNEAERLNLQIPSEAEKQRKRNEALNAFNLGVSGSLINLGQLPSALKGTSPISIEPSNRFQQISLPKSLNDSAFLGRTSKITLKGSKPYFDSNKTKHFEGVSVDPVLAGQTAQLINGLIGAKNQKTHVARTVLNQLQEILPNISGNLLLETNLNKIATQARNYNSLNATADLGINALQNNALNSKIMDFLGQQGAQQTVALNQLRDKQTLAKAAYAQQRSDIANQNIANEANLRNQEQANRNSILLNMTDLKGKFLADRTQLAYNKEQEREGFNRQLSQISITNDIEKLYKPQMDEMINLGNKAQRTPEEELRLKELKEQWYKLSRKKDELLLRSLYSGKPYVPGDFEKSINL